jgi:hypothetical protein
MAVDFEVHGSIRLGPVQNQMQQTLIFVRTGCGQGRVGFFHGFCGHWDQYVRFLYRPVVGMYGTLAVCSRPSGLDEVQTHPIDRADFYTFTKGTHRRC